MGAQPTGSIHNLLVNKGVITGKKVNVLPKKTSQKKEVIETAPTPVIETKEETPVSEAASAVGGTELASGETKSAETASAS